MSKKKPRKYGVIAKEAYEDCRTALVHSGLLPPWEDLNPVLRDMLVHFTVIVMGER